MDWSHNERRQYAEGSHGRKNGVEERTEDAENENVLGTI